MNEDKALDISVYACIHVKPAKATNFKQATTQNIKAMEFQKYQCKRYCVSRSTLWRQLVLSEFLAEKQIWITREKLYMYTYMYKQFHLYGSSQEYEIHQVGGTCGNVFRAH